MAIQILFVCVYFNTNHGGVSISGRDKVFLFLIASILVPGAKQPPNQWFTWTVSLEEKRPGREADH
jgi:hypothetical protein